MFRHFFRVDRWLAALLIALAGTALPVLAELVGPVSPRKTAVFSRTPRRFPVQAPAALRLRVETAGQWRDAATGQWLPRVTVTEVSRPSTGPAWDDEILMRELRTEQGALIGFESHGTRDNGVRRRMLANLTRVRGYGVHDEATDQLRRVRPWPLPVGTDPSTGRPGFVIKASHGTRHSFVAVGRYGRKFVSGSQDGRDFARRLAERNLPAGLPLLQWVCSAGSSRPGAVPPAQLSADQHPAQRVSYAGNTTLETMSGIGAWILGRHMFGGGTGEWPVPAWDGWWGPNPPYHTPVFVLTHHPRQPLVMEGGTTFFFVTDGFDSALEQAKAAAGDMDVDIAGGASTVHQALAAGVIDDLYLDIAPVVLGAGERMFSGTYPRRFEQVEVTHSPLITHIHYRLTP